MIQAMELQQNTTRNRKRQYIFGVTVLVVLVIALAFWWVYGHGYIEITVSNSQSENITYTLFEQNSQKTTTFTGGSYVKRLVARGDYEVFVQDQQLSSFQLAQTKGFLATTSLESSPRAESERTFVGNNPLPCMDYKDKLLVSYSCGGLLRDVQLHVPATEKQPTYIINPSDYLEADLQSIIPAKDSRIAIFREIEIDSEQGAPYFAVPLDNNLGLGNNIPLTKLAPTEDYQFTQYRDGFLAHRSDLREVWYYRSLAADPVLLPIAQPSDSSLLPVEIQVHNNFIAATYSNNATGEIADVHEEQGGQEVLNEIVLTNGQDTLHTQIRGQIRSAKPCAEQHVCLLRDGNWFEVYDPHEENPTPAFRISGVHDFLNLTDSIAVMRDTDVLNISSANGSGYSHFSLGDYTFCGTKPSTGGYLLCLINHRQRKVALYIQEKSEATDFIDKKVSNLLTINALSDVSAYGNYIYLSPNYGELTYQGPYGLDYDPRVQAEVNQTIAGEVSRLGIDPKKYTIINPFE